MNRTDTYMKQNQAPRLTDRQRRRLVKKGRVADKRRFQKVMEKAEEASSLTE